MFRKIVAFSLGVIGITALTACHQQGITKDTIKVGTIAGPETHLMEIAKKVAKKCYGLNVDIIAFSDYNTPNVALNDGSLGANMFQHLPYLQAQIKARGYELIAAGKTFIYPMGIYSKKLQQLGAMPVGAKLAIPNDPSNEARALLLLQKAGLIQLKPNAAVFATTADIASNAKKLQIVTLDAAQLPRALNDVDAAVINTNFAIPAGLRPSTALFREDIDSPYANIVAVRRQDKDMPQVNQLMSALHSAQVLAAAKDTFGDAAIPAWDTRAQTLPCTVAQ